MNKRPQITKAIIDFARQQPGGIIRWREANKIYVSMTAMRKSLTDTGHQNQNITKIFRKKFIRVMHLTDTTKWPFGAADELPGFYMLKESAFTDGEP